MKQIQLILAAFVSSFSFGQTIDYEYTIDDPAHIFHVKAGVFGDADFFENVNYRGGLYGGVELNVLSRLYVAGDMKFGLNNWQKKLVKSSDNDLGKSMFDVSGRVGFNFSVKESRPTKKLELKKTVVSSTRTSTHVSTVTQTQSINVAANHINIFALTGSVGLYRNQFNQKSRGIFDVNEPRGADNLSMNYTGLYFTGGFQIREYVNFLINGKNRETGEEYKEKGSRKHSNVIIEAMYMPVVSVTEQFSMLDGTTLTLAEKPVIQNLGVRIISEYTGLGLVNSGARIETGIRPGVRLPTSKSEGSKLANFYFQIGIFLAVNK